MGPVAVTSIGIAAALALIAMAATSDTMMGSILQAQDAINIQTQKNMEKIELFISGGKLLIENKGNFESKIKDVRIYADQNATNIISSTELNRKLGPLTKSEHIPSDLGVTDFNSKTVHVVTEFGNVFVATNLDDLATKIGTGTGNGTAMINGMGINSRITNFDFPGRLTHGYGDSGNMDSLKPYNIFTTTHDFAAQILDTDPSISIPITSFNREYRYDNATRSITVTGQTAPNILGYSQYQTNGGSVVPTVSSEGITISGTGTIMAKLNDYGGRTITIEGQVPINANLTMGYDPQYDYFALPSSSSYGFQFATANIPSPSVFTWLYSWNLQAKQYTWTITFPTPLVVSSASNFVAVSDNGAQFSIASGSINPSTKTYTVNSITYSQTSYQYTYSYYCPLHQWCYGTAWTSITTPTGVIHLYDKYGVFKNTVFNVSNQQYQNTHSFVTGKQYYIIAKPNGGTITIKGSEINPATTPYLKITNLPPNIPYEIEKDGKLATSGMSDSNGVVSLLVSEIRIGGTSPTGTLRLFPDSVAYRGPFSTVVIDNVNHQTLHIDTPEDRVYVAHAYVNIPVVGDVTVTDVYLDGTLHIPYLEGSYTTGDRIYVPVIPGYRTINMKINGIDTETIIANVLGGTGLKVIPPNSNTINSNNDINLISSIEATTGSVSYVIPTTADTITASVTATISGSSEIRNEAYFGSPPPQPPTPPRRDPLSAWVDVYVNGYLVKQQQIYYNAIPDVLNTSGVSGSTSYVVDKYQYPQTVINGVITQDASPGDFVEFYLYAKIHADGSTPPVPSGYILYRYEGQGYATATIHSGSILTS